MRWARPTRGSNPVLAVTLFDMTACGWILLCGLHGSNITECITIVVAKRLADTADNRRFTHRVSGNADVGWTANGFALLEEIILVEHSPNVCCGAYCTWLQPIFQKVFNRLGGSWIVFIDKCKMIFPGAVATFGASPYAVPLLDPHGIRIKLLQKTENRADPHRRRITNPYITCDKIAYTARPLGLAHELPWSADDCNPGPIFRFFVFFRTVPCAGGLARICG